MDSLDLLQQQNVYHKLPHPQDQYLDQQQQVNIALFQEKSSHHSPEGRSSCEEVRRNDGNSSDGGSSHSIELDRDSSLKEVENSNLQTPPLPSETIFSTGQTTEIETKFAGLDGALTNGQQVEGIISDDTCTEETQDEQANDSDDDAAFVALCTDASSVLNKHDPTRRYYINKLYQPLNGPQDDTPIEEQDDEYLLYQELRFLETVTQESTDERQGGAQLTKILEDDEGDEDIVDRLVGDGQREDPLDRLHLTTIIEAFESFPSSPLIESCHGSDPLIGGICSVNDHQCQDKPDSTRHGDSPIRSEHTNNYHLSMTQDHQHFDCEQLTGIGHSDDPNFSSVTSHSPMTHDSHHNHLHHNPLQHHQLDGQHYSHHINSDISSENNCFQQVSSTFIQPTEANEANSSNLLLNLNNSNEVQQQHQENYPDKINNKNLVERQPKKRSLQQIVQQENVTKTSPSKMTTKNRIKRKRTSSVEDTKSSHFDCNKSVSPVDGVTSSMMSQIETARCGIMDSNDGANKIDGYQQKSSFAIDDTGDAEGSMSIEGEEDEDEEEGSVINGGRRHHISKYRRRTANARERIRMREINQAFEELKKKVPIELASGEELDQTSASSRRGGKSNNGGGQQSDSQSVKLTKITTLRLAVSYIAKLSELLDNHPETSTNSMDQQSGLLGSGTNGGNTVSSPLIKAKNDNLTRGRKRRSRSSSKKSVDETKLRSVNRTKKNNCAVESDRSSKNNTNNNDLMKTNGSSEIRIEPSIMINQTNQRRQILITNNVLNNGLQQQATTFLPFQQQTQERLNQQEPQQRQIAYAHCNQQPLTISQTTTSNGQDRTFVTPVAVAILGIQTANNRGIGEHQGLQLLGIQNAQQLQQRAQHVQSNTPYSLITQQPQQVAFTLDDINGVSVLRLANTQNHTINTQQQQQQQQTIQFQPQGASMIQQPQVLTTTHATGYNYTTTYQPVHISQVQSANMATVRPVAAQQQAAMVQFRTNSVDGRTQETQLLQFSNDLRATISQRNIAISDNHIVTAANSTINTGTNSDCRNFGISPNMIAQHLNNNNNNISNSSSNNNINNNNNNNINNNSNVVQTTQFKIQQSNCPEGQLLSGNNTIPQGTRIFQTQPVSRCNTISSNQTQTNLIYINSTNLSQGNELAKTAFQQQQQQATMQHIDQTQTSNRSNNIQLTNNLLAQVDAQTSNGNNGNAPYEQMKFVTQFSSQINHSQDKSIHANEANIRQLVASLATSIQPVKGEPSSKGIQDEQACEQQQRQQPKRTYRFHNYDGNMITNHLYNNHDKNSQHQQDQQQQPLQHHQTTKRANHQQQQQTAQLIQLDQSAVANTTTTTTTSSNHLNTSQRSRQNSLSSTCSTNSCSSSSLTSLSTASPSVPMVSMMIKSPSLENSSTASSARSVMEETGSAEVVGCN